MAEPEARTTPASSLFSAPRHQVSSAMSIRGPGATPRPLRSLLLTNFNTARSVPRFQWRERAHSDPPHQSQRNLEAMATPVFGRVCPHCQSTTTICTAGTFDREVWECRACLRHFEIALHDDQRQMGHASAAVERQANPDPANVRCPQCGYGGGLYLAPKEDRTAATPVRCFACGADSPIEGWQTRAPDG